MGLSHHLVIIRCARWLSGKLNPAVVSRRVVPRGGSYTRVVNSGIDRYIVITMCVRWSAQKQAIATLLKGPTMISLGRILTSDDPVEQR